jgi:hypothetical protein
MGRGIFDLFQYAEKRKENCLSTVVFLHTKRMYSLRDVHVHISDEDEEYVIAEFRQYSVSTQWHC